MRMKPIRPVQLVIAGLIACNAAIGAAEEAALTEDDARALMLLEGARDARLSWNEGRLRLNRVVTEIGTGNRLEENYLIEWKGDAIRAQEMSEEGDLISCSVMRRGEILAWSRRHKGTINDADKDHHLILFDPRMLGACTLLLPNRTASQFLFRPKTKTRLRMEEMDSDQEGEGVWVETIRGGGLFINYRIIDAPGVFITDVEDKNNNITISSTYEGNVAIPVSSRLSIRSGGGNVIRTIDFRVSDLASVPISDDRFEMPSLGMEIGDPMVDQRMRRTIGFWNGTSLSESRSDALRDAGF